MFESINGDRISTLNEEINTKDFEIKKLKECVGLEANVYGYLITKATKYGRNVLLATKEMYISLPSRYVEKFSNLSIQEIEALKSGKVKITNIHDFESKNGITTVFDLK